MVLSFLSLKDVLMKIMKGASNKLEFLDSRLGKNNLVSIDQKSKTLH